MKKIKVNLNTLLKGKTDDVYVQFFRYFFVGGFAFVVDFGLLMFFYKILNVHYLISAAVGFLAGLTVNYILSKLWVFSKSQYKDLQAFLAFALIGLIGLGLNELIIFICKGLLGITVALSKVISTAIVFIFNFVARKILVF